VVKAQRERSQALNRFLARRMLADRLEKMAAQKRRDEWAKRSPNPPMVDDVDDDI
jgi:protein subunit release factor B